MSSKNLDAEYLKASGKFFQKAREECLTPGKNMLSQNWASPNNIFWAALGVIENCYRGISNLSSKTENRRNRISSELERGAK